MAICRNEIELVVKLGFCCEIAWQFTSQVSLCSFCGLDRRVSPSHSKQSLFFLQSMSLPFISYLILWLFGANYLLTFA